MFKSRSEGNVVYKCTVRLLEDDEILECEFQVSLVIYVSFVTVFHESNETKSFDYSKGIKSFLKETSKVMENRKNT